MKYERSRILLAILAVLTIAAASPPNPEDFYVDAKKYGGLPQAITALGSSSRTIMVMTQQTLTTDLTVPSNISLVVSKEGSIYSATTNTITIHGPFEAGLYKVFTGSVKVIFGTGAIKEVYPQWWGAKGDGSTDDRPAISAAVAAARGGNLYFPKGQYLTCNSP